MIGTAPIQIVMNLIFVRDLDQRDQEQKPEHQISQLVRQNLIRLWVISLWPILMLLNPQTEAAIYRRILLFMSIICYQILGSVHRRINCLLGQDLLNISFVK